MRSSLAAPRDFSLSREKTPAIRTHLSSRRIAVRWVSAIPAPGPPPTIPSLILLGSSVAIGSTESSRPPLAKLIHYPLCWLNSKSKNDQDFRSSAFHLALTSSSRGLKFAPDNQGIVVH